MRIIGVRSVERSATSVERNEDRRVFGMAVACGALGILSLISSRPTEAVQVEAPPAPAVSTTILPATTTAETMPQVMNQYADTVRPYAPIIEKYGKQYHINPCLIGAVIERESNGQADAYAGGTYGLMQLDPKTAESAGKTHNIPVGSLTNPDINIHIGSALLSDAAKANGIDASSSLSDTQVGNMSVHYHGIGFARDMAAGKSVPPHVTEAAYRLASLYDQHCR